LTPASELPHYNLNEKGHKRKERDEVRVNGIVDDFVGSNYFKVGKPITSATTLETAPTNEQLLMYFRYTILVKEGKKNRKILKATVKSNWMNLKAAIRRLYGYCSQRWSNAARFAELIYRAVCSRISGLVRCESLVEPSFPLLTFFLETISDHASYLQNTYY
jgi:hypothetical protein